MNTWCCVSVWLVLVRAIHFGACLLLLNVWIFDRFIVTPAARVWPTVGECWKTIMSALLWLAVPAALLSGTWWFILVAGGMSGLLFSQAMHPATLAVVWRQTVFGEVTQWRVLFWVGIIAAMGLKCVRRFRAVSVWIALAFSSLLCGSIAWTGHAQAGVAVRVHLPADVLHLLTAATWPTGLLPLTLLLWKLRAFEAPEKNTGMVALIGRFSAMSLIAVTLLIGTGYANALLLVGSWGNLFETAYGRVLLIKIGLLGMMVCLGAVNWLRLRPRLKFGSPRTISLLRINVAIELFLGTLILVIVGLLGLLPPVR